MSFETVPFSKTSLDALYYSGSYRALEPMTRGVGLIFSVQQIEPDAEKRMDVAGASRITPEQLEETITVVRDAGFEIVDLDEAQWRLTEGAFETPFVSFTLDCAMRDSIVHSYQIFRRHGAPFTVFVPTDFSEGTGDLWWLALEYVVSEVAELKVRIGGDIRSFRCESQRDKQLTYNQMYAWLRSLGGDDARRFMREISRGIGLKPEEMCVQNCMNWDEVRMLLGDPMIGIGGQSKSYTALSRLSENEALFEITTNLDRLEAETGKRPQHFAYPFGDARSFSERDVRLLKECGVKTALTNVAGMLYSGHCERLTALPRLQLRAKFASKRYLRLFLSGAPFGLRRSMRPAA